ncbi:OmpW family protein [Pseudoduganella sp. RAF19]|uniref:OmpW/AlkL family protein n=1 Tax=Pseudoduganella sp. RAF19 TaxID=3233052 RepID=UPI003F9D17A9
MKIRMQHVAKLAALAAAMGLSMGAQAQSKGEYMVKVGVNRLMPQVESGEFTAPTLPGSKTDVSADTKPLVTGAYMITDNISTELLLGAPLKHDLSGDGMIKGVGKLGTAEALPPTLMFQYRFMEPNAKFRPYVGLGITYAYFRKETGSATLTAFIDPGAGKPVTFEMDSKWAGNAQIGGTYRINEHWFGDVSVIKTKLKTTAHFSTGQSITAKLDPIAVTLAIGYKF